MELIITENTRKASTIQAALGEGCVVKACPAPRGDAAALADLIASARQAETITLATDPDREGESLAHDIVEALPGRARARARRVIFSQLSGDAIREALSQPRAIDGDQADAHRARKAITRLAGARVACLLERWGLNGGPTPELSLSGLAALRLVVEREWARRDATPQRRWTIAAELTHDGVRFRAEMANAEGIDTGEEACRVVEQLRLPGTTWLVEGITGRMEREAPPPPFTTGTLLGEAWRGLRFRPDRTQQAARALYETGLITYPHTRSSQVSPAARALARLVIADLYGQEGLPEGSSQDETNSVKDGIEAIRPTDPTLTPAHSGEALRRRGLDGDAVRLYGLIWRRFIASQMRPAAYAVVEATIRPHWWGSVEPWEEPELHPHPDPFEARWELALADGHRRVTRGTSDEAVPRELAALGEGVVVDVHELEARQHTGEEPPHFSPAGLAQALEAAGAGRPSDYAPAVEALLASGYIALDGDWLVPTRRGEDALYASLSQFPRLFEPAFMAEMEALLERVAAGEATARQAVEVFERAVPALQLPPRLMRAPRLHKEAV